MTASVGEKSEESVTSPAENSELEAKSENDDPKGNSCFSEDGMETEIEVTPENSQNPDDKKKKKKLKKKKGESRENLNSEEEPKHPVEDEGNKDNKKMEQDEKHSEKNSDVERCGTDLSKPEKKSLARRIFGKRVNRRSTMNFLPFFCLTCIIPVIAVYCCDVIISVNVLQLDGVELVKRQDNLYNVCSIAPLRGLTFEYEHRIHNTVLKEVLRLRSERTKRQAPDIVEAQEGPELVTATDGRSTSNSQTTEMTSPTEPSSSEESVQNTQSGVASAIPSSDVNPTASEIVSIDETMKEENVTEQPDPTTTSAGYEMTTVCEIYQTTGNYCESDDYFVQRHREAVRQDKKNDWYSTELAVLKRYQQALFFLFTVIGVIFLMSSIALRFDAYFRERWSSSILVMFMLYMISMSLTAKVFAIQTGSNGLRCFLCRMVSYCDDIDPWNMSPSAGNFPLHINWTLVVVVSYVLKIYDCIAIGFLTLKFVLDSDNAWWVSVLKTVSWVIIFPLMVVTPTAGVIRYEVLPVTIPDNEAARLGFEIVFYIGVAFWALALIILPIFCKFYMCNDEPLEYDEDAEYDDDDY
ncbi:uncharacterized protein LOC143470444 isoform X2 [Clavelina lepadiformis]|uniref:Uncharacterized protein n=1 Tax=Clavelina lepadiformis TaxID=159417 RepID=A0ABP0FT65_CLALP